MAAMTDKKRILALFDVDGTLTPARQTIAPEMKEFIAKTLRSKITVGIVGGSDLVKQIEQIGGDATTIVDYNFSENGLVAYKDGELIATQSIQAHLGEDNIKELVNFSLRYFADVDIPFKRGTFIEFRTGMINMSPVGRNCSKTERNDYEKFDLENKVRAKMIEAMQAKFAHLNLRYSIGGQISFDVFPEGWDKTYCLNFIPTIADDSLGQPYDEIHFFGDKTFEGGNDYEIFTHTRVIGHTVTSPEDCRTQCEKLFC